MKAKIINQLRMDDKKITTEKPKVEKPKIDKAVIDTIKAAKELKISTNEIVTK